MEFRPGVYFIVNQTSKITPELNTKLIIPICFNNVYVVLLT